MCGWTGDFGWYNYGFRYYDAQIGRFPQLDPLTDAYPFLTPYQYAGNEPIANVDVDGLEPLGSISGIINGGIVTSASNLGPVMVNAVRTGAQVASKAGSALTFGRSLLLAGSNLAQANTASVGINFLYPKELYPAGPAPAPAPAAPVRQYTLEELQQLKDHTNRMVLDITPIGDLKTIFSGTNFQGQKQSRAAAAGLLIFDMFGAEALSGLAKGIRGASTAAKTGGKIKYIGRLEDLKGVPRSQTLLDELPNLGSPRANYYQNMSVLRKAIKDGYTIKDASWFRPNSELAPTLLNPNRTVGQTFLGAERLLLTNRGLWP